MGRTNGSGRREQWVKALDGSMTDVTVPGMGDSQQDNKRHKMLAENAGENIVRNGLAVVTCGGTITMNTDSDNVRRSGSSDSLLEHMKTLTSRHVQVSTAGEKDSAETTTHDWANILATVQASQANEKTPVIITHGTDTLAWTAGMLAVAGNWNVPVVLTGANTPYGDPNSDAETNLQAALAVAETGRAGVYVAFSGTHDGEQQVFQGGYVRKTKAHNDVYTGLPRRLGYVNNGTYIEEHEPAPTPHSNSTSFGKRLLLIRCAPSIDADMYKNMLKGTTGGRQVHRPEHVIIEMYPGATVSGAVQQIAETCIELGIDVTACPVSPRNKEEGIYESTRKLAETGVTIHMDATIEILVALCAGN